MAGKTPRVQSASEPIRELVRIVQPIKQGNVAGVQINPATEDTLAAQPDFAHGQTTVGTIETQLIAISTPCKKGVLVKALSTNTGVVYIGKTGVATTSGYELTAGEAVTIEIDDVNKVFGIADTTGQKVSWIGV